MLDSVRGALGHLTYANDELKVALHHEFLSRIARFFNQSFGVSKIGYLHVLSQQVVHVFFQIRSHLMFHRLLYLAHIPLVP